MIIVVPLLLLQIITSFVFYNRHWEGVSKRLAISFAGDLNAIVELLDNQKDDDRKNKILDIIEESMGISATFYENKKLGDGYSKKELGLFGKDFFIYLKRNVKNKIAVMPPKNIDDINIHILVKGGVLVVTVPKKRFFSLTTNTFLIWIFIIGIILFGTASIFLKNQVRFVSKLSLAAEKFGKGQEIDDFKPQGASEVRQAGVAFMQMKNRIQRQISERTMMLAGISHDLRTPLTRMKLQLAMMNGEDVDGLNADILEMEKMIDGYLAFIKGGGREIAEMTEISPYIEDIVGRFKKHGYSLDLNIEDNVSLKIRRGDLARAISNILTNAGKYGKNISMIVRKEAESLLIIIMDDGPGIPYLSRSDVFRAFYRIDESRNKETGGVGLGLTISRDIVLSHGGDIFLDDSPMGGLKVTINIPV